MLAKNQSDQSTSRLIEQLTKPGFPDFVQENISTIEPFLTTDFYDWAESRAENKEQLHGVRHFKTLYFGADEFADRFLDSVESYTDPLSQSATYGWAISWMVVLLLRGQEPRRGRPVSFERSG